ncbi:hypothetical protein ACRALDRAFT_206759 [Sodiomyces alcalophilus JCM 7366]|uniref:uncharacterized protein n=1 Tax=Sodiomyces alcalophilus JCM 7366 TaxID=591952 RepID=UPI0039B4D5F2
MQVAPTFRQQRRSYAFSAFSTPKIPVLGFVHQKYLHVRGAAAPSVSAQLTSYVAPTFMYVLEYGVITAYPSSMDASAVPHWTDDCKLFLAPWRLLSFGGPFSGARLHRGDYASLAHGQSREVSNCVRFLGLVPSTFPHYSSFKWCPEFTQTTFSSSPVFLLASPSPYVLSAAAIIHLVVFKTSPQSVSSSLVIIGMSTSLKKFGAISSAIEHQCIYEHRCRIHSADQDSWRIVSRADQKASESVEWVFGAPELAAATGTCLVSVFATKFSDILPGLKLIDSTGQLSDSCSVGIQYQANSSATELGECIILYSVGDIDSLGPPLTIAHCGVHREVIPSSYISSDQIVAACLDWLVSFCDFYPVQAVTILRTGRGVALDEAHTRTPTPKIGLAYTRLNARSVKGHDVDTSYVKDVVTTPSIATGIHHDGHPHPSVICEKYATPTATDESRG